MQGNRNIEFLGSNLSALITLNLSHTCFKEIPRILLRNSPLLTNLNLSENQLTSIPLKFWKDAIHLKHVSFTQNPCLSSKFAFHGNSYVVIERSRTERVLPLIEIARKALDKRLVDQLPVSLVDSCNHCYICDQIGEEYFHAFFLAGEDGLYLKHDFYLCSLHASDEFVPNGMDLSDSWGKSASCQGLLA